MTRSIEQRQTARTMTEVMQDIDYASIYSSWNNNQKQREAICIDIMQLKAQLSSLERFLAKDDLEGASSILRPNRCKVISLNEVKSD